jgi:hypothetical protein
MLLNVRRAAVAGAVLAAGLLAGCTSAGSPAVSPASRPAPVVTADRATGVILGAGHTGTRAQVPWGLVGPGWVLAEYAPATGSPMVVELIDPAGGRYQMYRFPAGVQNAMLIDWSPASRRALFRYPSMQVSLTSGAVLATANLGAVLPAYTQPGGKYLLATTANGVELYSLAGREVKQLAAGAFGSSSAVYSPSGTTFAVGDSDGVALIKASGGLVRQLAVGGHVGCVVARWWTPTTIEASCGDGGLWLVPVSGAQPTRLAPQGHLGNIAWRLPSGLYEQSSNSANFDDIARVSADGKLTQVPVPGTGYDIVLTAIGSRLLVEAADTGTTAGGLPGMVGGGSLLWFNPATGAEQWLVKIPRGETGVVSAFAYPDDLNAVYNLGL